MITGVTYVAVIAIRDSDVRLALTCLAVDGMSEPEPKVTNQLCEENVHVAQ